MTKAIRIENADTSNHKVVVEVWYKNHVTGEDVKEKEVLLDYPTSMTTEYIHDSKYLIIRENGIRKE